MAALAFVSGYTNPSLNSQTLNQASRALSRRMCDGFSTKSDPMHCQCSNTASSTMNGVFANFLTMSSPWQLQLDARLSPRQKVMLPWLSPASLCDKCQICGRTARGRFHSCIQNLRESNTSLCHDKALYEENPWWQQHWR